MIDFAYNQYNEIGKKTVSMQRQEGHSQMKDKSETSTTDLIILFFLLFIISNILFAVACMLLSDEADKRFCDQHGKSGRNKHSRIDTD